MVQNGKMSIAQCSFGKCIISTKEAIHFCCFCAYFGIFKFEEWYFQHLTMLNTMLKSQVIDELAIF